MNKTWQTWLAFALCAGLAIAALAWLTSEAVRADLDRSVASRQAELEQKVSLVLWRMDTKLAPLIAEEVARPVSYFRNPGNWALNSSPQQAEQQALPVAWSGTLPDNVIMNFSCSSRAACQSPQVPEDFFGENQLADETRARWEQLQQLSREVKFEDLLQQLPEESTDSVQPTLEQDSNFNSFAGNRLSSRQSRSLSSRSSKGNNDDFDRRAQRYQASTQQELRKQRGGNYDNPNSPFLQQRAEEPAPSPEPSITGVTRPIWVGDNLLLARRVVIEGRTEIQGSWLDWPGLREDLLSEAADLLPNASLSPVRDADDADPTRMLAGLPVEINPGEKLVGPFGLSPPMQWALLIGWIAFLFALASAAVLLAGVLALSERRAAFVSSVTHELRTPLTTFRMYSDMLARGMVPDSERRQQYLETLRREAERLTHLVENVLSYARLERGRKVNRQETVSVDKVVERLQQRLTDRAKEADLELQLEMNDGAESCLLTTDVGVVEQILFNLVDNACKYATPASDRSLHWQVASNNGHVALTIRDHGPGFNQPSRAQRSQAFSKTSEEAAVTAPGVGLGLALCRKLAKQLGGRLDISDSIEGVTATLRLPVNAV